MQQLDQYLVPFSIKENGTLITPDNCDEVLIKIGPYQKTSGDGGITYDSESQKWLYPLTSEMSSKLPAQAQYQIAVIRGNTRLLSHPESIAVNPSIFGIEDL